MKLQTSTSLALYSVLEAASRPDQQVSAADIAAKYGVSTHHLAKVLRELARAGILDSARGVGGGYRMSGNVKRLTLMDVIEIFEDMSARSPEAGDESTEVGRAIGQILTEVDEIAKATFRSITVETMLKLIERERHADESAGVRAARCATTA